MKIPEMPKNELAEDKKAELVRVLAKMAEKIISKVNNESNR